MNWRKLISLSIKIETHNWLFSFRYPSNSSIFLSSSVNLKSKSFLGMRNNSEVLMLAHFQKYLHFPKVLLLKQNKSGTQEWYFKNWIKVTYNFHALKGRLNLTRFGVWEWVILCFGDLLKLPLPFEEWFDRKYFGLFPDVTRVVFELPDPLLNFTRWRKLEYLKSDGNFWYFDLDGVTWKILLNLHWHLSLVAKGERLRY